VGDEKTLTMAYKKGYKSEKKGKTLEEIYGKEKAKTLKENHSKLMREKYKKGELFIPNQKGFKHSKKTKEKISNDSKKHWRNLEYRKKYSKTKIKLYRNNKVYLNKLRIRAKKSWENPKVREIREIKLNKSWENSKRRIRASKLMKENRKHIIIPVKDTSIEIKLQNFLKQLGITFFTHQYMKEIKHGYQCDIFIPSLNMVIECDGDYWHKYPTGNDIDHIRTKELLDKGFKVLRLWECEIRSMNLNKFKLVIGGIPHARP